MATKGYAAADTDIRALTPDTHTANPKWGYFDSSAAYTINKGLEASIAINTAAPSGWTTAWILKSFSTGNYNIIPRNLDANSMLVNVSDINGQSGSNISGTLTTRRVCYKFPGGIYLSTPTDGTRIDAAQLNGIGIEFTTYSLTGSGTANANSYATINVSGTVPAGYTPLGIANWQSGHKWCVVYAVYLADSGTTGTVSVRNVNKTHNYTTSGTRITALAYKILNNPSSVYRTRVTAGTTIQAAHINNTKLTISNYIKNGASTATVAQNAATISFSGSTTSGYTAIPAVVQYNTGYKYLLPREVTTASITCINVGSNYTVTPSMRSVQYYFS